MTPANRMMERVCILTDLPVPATTPEVHEVPWDELWDRRPGVWALYLKATNDGPAKVVHAPGYAHLIVHEFCHHAQQEAGKAAASPECEKQAYWVQSVYFRLWPED